MGGGGDSGGGSGGGGGGCTQKCAYNAAKMDRILVKYRPIAPKPTVSGSVFGPVSNNNYLLTKPRAKRRYVRHKKREVVQVKNSGSGSGSGSGSERSEGGGRERELMTLPLLPSSPVRGLGPTDTTPIRADPSDSDRRALIPNQQAPMSTVTVECVEASWGDHDHKMINLAHDTCPGFVSDGYNRVWWTNQAYKMKAGSEVVSLVMKDEIPLVISSFVCRVRWEYTWKAERRSMVVPCDVWRIESGDFAWRLDVQAALSLGR